MKIFKNERFRVGNRTKLRYNPYDKYVLEVKTSTAYDRYYIIHTDVPYTATGGDVIASPIFGGYAYISSGSSGDYNSNDYCFDYNVAGGIDPSLTTTTQDILISKDTFFSSMSEYKIDLKNDYYVFRDVDNVVTESVIRDVRNYRNEAFYDLGSNYSNYVDTYITIVVNGIDYDELMQIVMSEYVSVESCTYLYSLDNVNPYSHSDNQIYGYSINPLVRLGRVTENTIEKTIKDKISVELEIKLLG